MSDLTNDIKECLNRVYDMHVMKGMPDKFIEQLDTKNSRTRGLMITHLMETVTNAWMERTVQSIIDEWLDEFKKESSHSIGQTIKQFLPYFRKYAMILP